MDLIKCEICKRETKKDKIVTGSLVNGYGVPTPKMNICKKCIRKICHNLK